jgi:hypothetical protein
MATQEVTSDEWTNQQTNRWAVKDGLLVIYTPTLPILTPDEQATLIFDAGLTVTCASGNFTATFAVDSTVQADIAAERLSLLATGKFTNGQITLPWVDITKSWHVITIDQFVSLAGEISSFVKTLKLFSAGAPGISLPNSVVTIA